MGEGGANPSISPSPIVTSLGESAEAARLLSPRFGGGAPLFGVDGAAVSLVSFQDMAAAFSRTAIASTSASGLAQWRGYARVVEALHRRGRGLAHALRLLYVLGGADLGDPARTRRRIGRAGTCDGHGGDEPPRPVRDARPAVAGGFTAPRGMPWTRSPATST